MPAPAPTLTNTATAASRRHTRRAGPRNIRSAAGYRLTASPTSNHPKNPCTRGTSKIWAPPKSQKAFQGTSVRYPLEKVESWLSSPRSSTRSEEHTSELQSLAYLVCRLLLEKKKMLYDIS